VTKIEGQCREVCEATEFVAIVTCGKDGPHIVGNWGEYIRTLGIGEDSLVFPAGRYHQTEKNLQNNSCVQLLIASKKVQGSMKPGQGFRIEGVARILTSGKIVDHVKSKFPWARGAMIVDLTETTALL
jgi:predicted pyridoxine 5'-phosphate oxidase superfamily flavin-nucleotide-binding protein